MSKLAANIRKIIRDIDKDIKSFSYGFNDISIAQKFAINDASNKLILLFKSDEIENYLYTKDCVIFDIYINEHMKPCIDFMYQGVKFRNYEMLDKFMGNFFETVEWLRMETINGIING